jgi:predicted metal-dependent TIM-barrel fold hydrolase
MEQARLLSVQTNWRLESTLALRYTGFRCGRTVNQMELTKEKLQEMIAVYENNRQVALANANAAVGAIQALQNAINEMENEDKEKCQ